mmetsp:Transcript_123296/g.359995  ORF Transcript_123296/g.359995 Transcript_123296/m.359995 type:complete len:396 (-) Transcript_123296:31-1218(-)
MAEAPPPAASPSEVVLRPKPPAGTEEAAPARQSTVSSRRISFSRPRATSPALRNFRKKVKNAQLLLISSSKVAEENKIGEPPTGWFRDLALALQRGIANEPATPSSTPVERKYIEGFKAAEPELFARARAACGVPSARYAATMGLQEGQTDPSLRLVSTGAGKSGAFFLLSPDQQCIAKSCTDEDWHTLLKILPKYVERLEAARAKEDSPHKVSQRDKVPSCSGFIETLLPRYFGLYMLTDVAEGHEQVKVLVMANVFSGSRKIHRRYDLKGSTAGRLASSKELKKASPVLKDMDWVRDQAPISLPDATRTKVLLALQQEPSRYEAMNVVYIRDKSRLCYLGIVDILTPYGWRKWTETLFRGTLQCGSDISCQKPGYYGNRFLRFMTESVVAAAE